MILRVIADLTDAVIACGECAKRPHYLLGLQQKDYWFRQTVRCVSRKYNQTIATLQESSHSRHKIMMHIFAHSSPEQLERLLFDNAFYSGFQNEIVAFLSTKAASGEHHQLQIDLQKLATRAAEIYRSPEICAISLSLLNSGCVRNSDLLVSQLIESYPNQLDEIAKCFVSSLRRCCYRSFDDFIKPGRLNYPSAWYERMRQLNVSITEAILEGLARGEDWVYGLANCVEICEVLNIRSSDTYRISMLLLRSGGVQFPKLLISTLIGSYPDQLDEIAKCFVSSLQSCKYYWIHELIGAQYSNFRDVNALPSQWYAKLQQSKDAITDAFLEGLACGKDWATAATSQFCQVFEVSAAKTSEKILVYATNLSRSSASGEFKLLECIAQAIKIHPSKGVYDLSISLLKSEKMLNPASLFYTLITAYPQELDEIAECLVLCLGTCSDQGIVALMDPSRPSWMVRQALPSEWFAKLQQSKDAITDAFLEGLASGKDWAYAATSHQFRHLFEIKAANAAEQIRARAGSIHADKADQPNRLSLYLMAAELHHSCESSFNEAFFDLELTAVCNVSLDFVAANKFLNRWVLLDDYKKRAIAELSAIVARAHCTSYKTSETPDARLVKDLFNRIDANSPESIGALAPLLVSREKTHLVLEPIAELSRREHDRLLRTAIRSRPFVDACLASMALREPAIQHLIELSLQCGEPARVAHLLRFGFRIRDPKIVRLPWDLVFLIASFVPFHGAISPRWLIVFPSREVIEVPMHPSCSPIK